MVKSCGFQPVIFLHYDTWHSSRDPLCCFCQNAVKYLYKNEVLSFLKTTAPRWFCTCQYEVNVNDVTHIKDVIISEFSSDSSKTVYPGRPYTLIHIWNIFWMVISGFFDDLTVVADVFAYSIVGIHSNAFEKSRCPW